MIGLFLFFPRAIWTESVHRIRITERRIVCLELSWQN